MRSGTMSHLHRDSAANPIIQHFLQYVEEQTSPGIRSTAQAHVEPLFVNPDALSVYFEDRERAEKLLQEARRESEDTLSIQDVTRSHTIVFSILLYIGMGEHIKNFTRWTNQLSDQQLPFFSKPFKFPKSTNDATFFESFASRQWMFCPHHFSQEHDSEIEEQRILPIRSCEKIGEGGSAIAYLVEIDEAYDHLLQSPSEISRSLTAGPVEQDQNSGKVSFRNSARRIGALSTADTTLLGCSRSATARLRYQNVHK